MLALGMGSHSRRTQALRVFEGGLLDLLVVQFFQLLDAQFLGYLAVLVNLALLGLRALRVHLRTVSEPNSGPGRRQSW